MIVVRNVFRLKFGAAKEAKAVMKEGQEFLNSMGAIEHRVCTDVTGPFYTMVLENTWESLGGFEAALGNMGKDPKWQAWYAKFSAHVESGYREIFSIVS